MAFLLASCASAAPDSGVRVGSGEQDLSIVLADGTAHGLTLTRGTQVSRAEIVGSREIVWQTAPAAFQEIGLPRPAIDRNRWLAAVQGHRASSRLGGERLSRYFDCGRGPVGLHADHGRLTMDVQVALTDDDGMTIAEIRADAVAQSVDGARSGTMPCSSTGRLEEALAVALQLHALRNERPGAPEPEGDS